jgi:DNA-binding SARP family transcriptional activator
MEFRILGPLEVVADGKPVDVRGAKQRALLAMLLLEANRPVSADRLVDALWEERPTATAQKALQVYISQLRRQLGAERLLRSPGGYRLSVGSGEFDLSRFESLRAEGRVVEALALWRGPPLEEFAQQRFADGEIARLEELRLQCLEERVDSDLVAGRHAAVVAELEALVRDHPFRERFWGQLLLALYRCGRQADALAAYRAARVALVDGLGIEPGRGLRELEQAILRQDASLDLQPPGRTADEAAIEPRGFLVGRELELAELRAGLDAAVGGRGGLFLLVGEPGIGKSRLAEEVIEDAHARGASTLVGRCWEAGGAPAYWPWVQSLRAYVERSEPAQLRSQLGAGAAELAQIVPELREIIGQVPEPSPETEGARFRLFDATARFLKAAAAERPLVLVLDDLHAADEPSLVLLRFLAGEIRDSRILVVGTYRDVDPTVGDPLAATLAELSRERVTRRLQLSGLTAADISRYIESSLGVAASARLVEAIRTETEGNPLFVGEVVQLLAAEGPLGEIDVGRLWALGIPQGIREVIGRRLGRLSAACVETLTAAAVLGREFRLDALEQVASESRQELLQVLDEALAVRLLTSVPADRGRLRFAHVLIRETLYDRLPTLRRVELHRRAGEALEALYGARRDPHLAELSYHFFEAAPGGEVDKAITYARRAGERALGLLAYEEAARLFELALQALDLRPPVDSHTRSTVLLSLGDAQAKAGHTPEAKRTFLAAADLARAAALDENLALAALGYGGRFPWLRAGDDHQLVPLLEEALTSLGGEESALRVRLMARLAGALRDQPSLEPRASLAQEAVEIARRLDDPAALGYALTSLFMAMWGPNMEQLVTIADEVTPLADEIGDAERSLDACWVRRIAWLTLGDMQRAEQAARDHSARAHALKQPSQQWYDGVMRSSSALFRGDFAEAEAAAEETLRLGRRAQSWDATFSHRMLVFGLRREQGRLAEVQELLERTTAEYRGYWSLRWLTALVECELDQVGEAREAFRRLSASEILGFPRDSEWLFGLSVLTEVAAHEHDRDRAALLYELLQPFVGLNASLAAELWIGAVARYVAIAANAAGRPDDGATYFEQALILNARMGARPSLAHTQHDYGRMLLNQGEAADKDRALQLLHAATATYLELGMSTYADRAAGPLAQQSGGKSR